MANSWKGTILIAFAATFVFGTDMKQTSGRPKQAKAVPPDHHRQLVEAGLRIRGAKQLLASGGSFVLTLSIKNSSQALLFVQVTYPERDYRFEVKKESGEEVQLSESGRKLLKNDAIYKNVGMKLMPGERLEEKVDLRSLYTFDVGNYSVTVKRRIDREDGSEFEITSNTMRFKVIS